MPKAIRRRKPGDRTYPIIAAILAAVFAATPATFLAQTEEGATAVPMPAFATEIEMERRFNEFRSQYLDDRADSLDDRADSINWWLTVIAIVLTFFAIAIPIAFAFGVQRFLNIESDARKHVDEIKAHKAQAQRAVDDIRGLTAQDAANPAKTKQVEKAVETVQQTPDASPIDKAIAMAHSLQKAGETKKAIEKWRSIAGSMEGIDNKVAAGAWFSVGYLLFLSKNPIKAIHAYDQAIRLDPGVAVAYNNRGTAKAYLGQYEEAIQDFSEAIRLNPKYSAAYINRGNAKSELKWHEDAIMDYGRAILLNPNYFVAHNSRGSAKIALQRHEEAIKDFDEAIRLNSHYSVAYYNRGLAKCNLERFEEANADFQTALRLAQEQGDEKRVTAITDSLRKIDNPETN